MGTEKKFKTSNVTVCLEAINAYVNMDESTVTSEKKEQLKKGAQNAVGHLSLLFSPGAVDVLLGTCPTEELPTIL